MPVTAANLKERSETLLEQYGKTGSLFPHNVVLVPLGDDFTYDHESEWDQQYSNYKMIMDYINQVRDTARPVYRLPKKICGILEQMIPESYMVYRFIYKVWARVELID